MAGRLSREHHDDDEDEDSPFWTPGQPDDPEPGWPLTNPSTPEERDLAAAFRFDYLTDTQEAILTRTNASLITGPSMYLEWRAEADAPEQLAAIFEKSQARSRGLLLSNPFTLPLPTLPRATGEAEDFTRLTRDRLEEFRSRLPLFRTLLTPVTLTFLVIPPKQGKDLDNIALTAHDVRRPHIAPHLLALSYRGEPDPRHEEALARLKSVNAQSVRAYQVIELPRTP